AAYVGGHAVLGAYAARIVFRDLPRPLAATTMTTIFSSFDGLAVAALALLAIAVVARAAALGRSGIHGAHLAVAAAALGVLVAGVLGVAWAHPAIEEMFRDGDTLSPRFAAMHKLAEKLGHLEALFGLALFATLAW